MNLQGFFRHGGKGARRGDSRSFSEQQALERIEAGFVVGGWCVGALAGLLKGLYTDQPPGVVAWTVAGLLAVAAAGMAGCFVGLMLRLLRKALRKGDANDGQAAAPELVASLSLGTGVGSFLGALAAIFTGAWALTPWIAAAGALAACALFTLSGDVVRVLMRMMALDSRAARRAGYTGEAGSGRSHGRLPLAKSSSPEKEPEKNKDKGVR